jgi:hypothetical protein
VEQLPYKSKGVQESSPRPATVILKWPERDFDTAPVVYPLCGSEEEDEASRRAISLRWPPVVNRRRIGTSVRDLFSRRR